MEKNQPVLELVQDSDGVFKAVAECEEKVKVEVKKRAKPKTSSPEAYVPPSVQNNPMYQFLDGAEVSMKLINRAMEIFSSQRGRR